MCECVRVCECVGLILLVCLWSALWSLLTQSWQICLCCRTAPCDDGVCRRSAIPRHRLRLCRGSARCVNAHIFRMLSGHGIRKKSRFSIFLLDGLRGSGTVSFPGLTATRAKKKLTGEWFTNILFIPNLFFRIQKARFDHSHIHFAIRGECFTHSLDSREYCRDQKL